MNEHGLKHSYRIFNLAVSESRKMDAMAHVYHAAKCSGKKGYKSRAAAARAKKRCAREFGKRYRVYLCPYCSMYHLSTSTHKVGEKGGRDVS